MFEVIMGRKKLKGKTGMYCWNDSLQKLPSFFLFSNPFSHDSYVSVNDSGNRYIWKNHRHHVTEVVSTIIILTLIADI